MKKILIVDDDEDIRMIFSFIFRDLCEVKLAENGLVAYGMIQQNNGDFDLVITDYNMPHMDGIVLSAKIKELYPSMKVVLVTAALDFKELKSKADKVLSKDFNLSMLINEFNLA